MKHNKKPLFMLAIASLLTACGNPAANSTSQDVTSTANSTTSSATTSSGNSSAASSATSQTTSKEALPAISYVKIFAPAKYTHIWAWERIDGEDINIFSSSWPGEELVSYDDNWKTYDFMDKTSLYVIVSQNGSNQTADSSLDGEGYWWYTGSKWEHTNVEPDTPSGGGGGGGAISDWSGTPGTIYKDPEGYQNPTVDQLPTPSYTTVESAADYSELPAVANYSGSVINKYAGTRTDFRDESIYFAITTRFYDGDSTNNTHCWDSKNDATEDPNWRGDFKGLIEKMDYIKALGFTAIWITPICKNASGFDYHGYHAINFKQVDPRYESEDVDFQKVINEAHKRDMKIVLDVVFNHTCNFGEENLFPLFYYDAANNTTIKSLTRFDNDLLPANYFESSNQGQLRFDALKTDAGDPSFIYHHDPDGALSWESYSEQTGQIAGDCVDLNTENPTVANYLIEAYAKFIKMGVDAFRIDTMKHLSRLTLNKYFFPAFKEIARRARGDDNFHMFGEVCVKDTDVWNRGQQSDSVPFYTWAETRNYEWGTYEQNKVSAKQHWSDYLQPTNHQTSNNAYLNGVTYHTPDHSGWSMNSVIDFPMHWNFDNARNSFSTAVSKDNVYNDATYNVVYVDSHDYAPNENQTLRYVKGTSDWKENLSLMFTFRGIPCIFYGSEIEFQKGKTIDNGPNLALANSGRAYFGDHLEGSVTPTGFGTYENATGELANTLNSTLSRHLQKLSQARNSCIALRRGQYTTSNVSGSGMAFTRRYTEGGVDSVAAVCISGNASFNSLPNGTYVDLYGGSTATVSNGTLYANASGQGSVQIWVKQ